MGHRRSFYAKKIVVGPSIMPRAKFRVSITEHTISSKAWTYTLHFRPFLLVNSTRVVVAITAQEKAVLRLYLPITPSL